MPRFSLPDDSPLRAGLGPRWRLLPLRIPGGWAVHQHGIDARLLPSGEVETNDSEDLFWARKLPPPNTERYEVEPDHVWRKIQVDVGWYRDHYRMVMLDPDWDHVSHRFTTTSLEEIVVALERWLVEIGNKGRPAG